MIQNEALRELRKSLFTHLLIGGLLVGSTPSFAQNQRNSDRTGMPSYAITQAAQQVSLSAEKILEVLNREPGLLLVIKKDLVTLAYEQGRLLDPEDLTDDAIFRLVREDNNVRIIVTREIEDRFYIRAKPTQREEAEAADKFQLEKKLASQPATQTQEAKYWTAADLEREKQLEELKAAKKNANQSSPLPDRDIPDMVPTMSLPSRQLNQAGLTGGGAGLSTDQQAALMQRMGPNDVPSMLAASSSQSDLPASQLSMLGRSQGASLSGLSTSDELAALAGSGALSNGTDNSSQLPQQASLIQPRIRAQMRSNSGSDYTSTDIRQRPNPYANVPSLYDLYSQVNKRQPVLQRFGADIFQNGTGNVDVLPMDLPVGPDYVIGPGDGLSINLSGSVSQRLQRTVDREGRIALPETGAVLVAGRSLGDVQQQVQTALRSQFRDVQADVSLARLRTVRIYVVGDVASPGAYDISSLSTPLNALNEAGGPTERGSLRTLKHFRGKQLVQEVDLYDLILHGVRTDIQRMQPGDTILVPPIGKQVTLEGMVRRPGIYELRSETDLAEALELAGGVLPSGTLRHIDVERLQAHEQRSMLNLNIPEGDEQSSLKALQDFKVQDGDRIRISPILPYSQKTVYLDGHVFHPGKYPFADGMKVKDLIKSYADLLPEPYQNHAEIIRLEAPDFRPTVISFNLADALNGKDWNLPLKPFDTVRVFGRFDFEDSPTVTVTGEVRKPGDHITNGETHLTDALFLAGGITQDGSLGDVQVFRRTNAGKISVLNVNLGKALTGDQSQNIILQPKDRVVIQRNMAKLDPPSVTISGEVATPGKYPLGGNMTAADLVQTAGGFKRGAYTETADLARYVLENGSKVLGEHQQIPIGRAVAGEADTDIRLRDGDVLTIGQITGWKNIGATITVRGEVTHPGGYGINQGERLSSILERAGGFAPDAYIYGAVLERVQVRELAEISKQDLIRRIEAGQDIKVSAQATGQEQAALVQAAMQQQQQVLNSLKSQPVNGRLVIRISKDIKSWKGTSADIEVRAGDVLTVPKPPNFVLVSGQVYNSSAMTYVPGKNVEYYLRQAGGPTDLGNRGAIFVVRADGSLVGREGQGGFWNTSVADVRLRPGDTIVVPEKFVTGSSAFKTLLSVANVLSQIAFTATVALR